MFSTLTIEKIKVIIFFDGLSQNKNLKYQEEV
jgi:hypothetical protein